MNVEFFSAKNLATMSGETVAVWRKRILHRQITFTKFGRNVRVSREAYERFITERTVNAHSQNPRGGAKHDR
jgi:hypothetical protein